MRKPTRFNELVEEYYAKGAYPAISKVNATISDAIPFNIGDIMIVAPTVLGLPKFKDNKIVRGIGIAMNVHSMIGMSYMLHNFRIPLECKLELELEDLDDQATMQNLRGVAKNLHTVYTTIIDNDIPALDNQTVLDLADRTLDEVMQKIEGVTIRGPKKIKHGVRIQAMSHLGVKGQFYPITHEVNIPSDNKPLAPFVITHEKAHSKGYSREHEANMIAYLACQKTGDEHFIANAEYWRLGFGLTSLSGKLEDKLTFLDSLDLPDELKREFRSTLTDKDKGPSGFQVIQNAMLKVLGEPEGVKSYNETFTRLLIAYEKSGKSI